MFAAVISHGGNHTNRMWKLEHQQRNLRGKQHIPGKNKEKVVVACWGNQMLDTYTLVETTLSMTGNRGAVCNDSTLYVSSDLRWILQRMRMVKH